MTDENEEYKVPDRIGGLEALNELREVCAGREWRFVEVDVTFEVSPVADVDAVSLTVLLGISSAPGTGHGSDVSLYDR